MTDIDPITELSDTLYDALYAITPYAEVHFADQNQGLENAVRAVLTEAAAKQWIDKQLAEAGLKAMGSRNGKSMGLEPTPAPLSPEREKEIRQGQPGDWLPGSWTIRDIDGIGDEPSRWELVHHESGTVLATLPDWAGNIALWAADAHDAVPELLAEVSRLRAELNQAHDDLTGACLARWEEEQDNARLRLALASAQRGRREARNRTEDKGSNREDES